MYIGLYIKIRQESHKTGENYTNFAKIQVSGKYSNNKNTAG